MCLRWLRPTSRTRSGENFYALGYVFLPSLPPSPPPSLPFSFSSSLPPCLFLVLPPYASFFSLSIPNPSMHRLLHSTPSLPPSSLPPSLPPHQAGHPFRITSLHVISISESATRHLMAVSNAGYR